MATPEQRTKRNVEVKAILAELSAISPPSLGRADLSAEVNFLEAVPFLEEMLGLVKELNSRDISRLSHTSLNNIHSACASLRDSIKEIQSFTILQDKPGDVSMKIKNTIKNIYDTVFDNLALPLTFTSTQSTDWVRIEREAKGFRANMEKESKQFSEQLATYTSDAKAALSAIKEQAAEAGVSSNAEIFNNEAGLHAKESIVWKKWTLISSGMTLLVAIVLFVCGFKYLPSTGIEAIQFTANKLILLTALSFFVYWSAKNYNAHKHNETLNKHRANALMTFRAFVEGTADDQIKDSILLQAAQAAFCNRTTGYESVEKESQTIPSVVEQVIKTAPKLASPKS